ncbi:MAG: hypothetical protein IT495_20750 [Gammaproteobacteria bacterium]|nr:hypothetical protein [Gammaproteobacteria bacterium]
MMEQKTLTVRFVTPAFLGNADQSAQWRTPPFKALLRQWWRVAAAPDYGFDARRLREAEAKLFGHAWLKNDADAEGRRVSARRSPVRIRMEPWRAGGLDTAAWPGGVMENVHTTKTATVRADVYLGFGPVLPPSKKEGRGVTVRRAIGTTQQTTVRIAYPAQLPDADYLQQALELIQWFGSLGSRSRNGWGSVHIEAGQLGGLNLPASNLPTLRHVLRPWQEAVTGTDWPHAIGSDNGNPLVWVTEPLPDWPEAMGRLANIRVAVRRAAKSFVGPNGIGGIHLLGYPAGGKWKIDECENEKLRLATQLRFKVLPAGKGKGVIGMVFHMPCRLPEPFRIALGSSRARWVDENQAELWSDVHGVLNDPVIKLMPLGDR